MTRPPAFPFRSLAAACPAAALLVFLAGCAGDTAAPEEAWTMSAAKGGGGGSGTGPVVQAASPAKGLQGDTIDVLVSGTGFDGTSRATWLLAGTADPHVKTLSTTYLSSTQISARIAIALDATVASWDIQVTADGGHKKGIGIELFAVEGDPAATFYLPVSAGSLGVWGEMVATDNTGLFAGTSRYRNGECGINSKIFATVAASNSGDAIMQTNNKSYTDRKCAYYPRKVWLSYAQPVEPGAAPGPVEQQPLIINVNELQNTLVAIPLNAIERRALNMGPAAGTCTALRWRYHLQDGTAVGGDSVYVQRVSSQTWHVYTAAGEDKAYCVSNGKLYRMPLDFYIEAQSPLPTG